MSCEVGETASFVSGWLDEVMRGGGRCRCRTQMHRRVEERRENLGVVDLRVLIAPSFQSSPRRATAFVFVPTGLSCATRVP